MVRGFPVRTLTGSTSPQSRVTEGHADAGDRSVAPPDQGWALHTVTNADTEETGTSARQIADAPGAPPHPLALDLTTPTG